MHRTRAPQESGFTLIELMVSITVGLILLAGIIQLFVSNKQAYRIQEGTNVVNENARYVLDQMERAIRLAGHFGGALPDELEVVAADLAVDCTESPMVKLASDPTKVGHGIEGFDGEAVSPLDCIPGADYRPNTDLLIVRSAGDERWSDDRVEDSGGDGQFVRVLTNGAGEIFDASAFASGYAVGGTSEGPALKTKEIDDKERFMVATYRASAAVYFIRNCSSQDRGTPAECDAADDDIPTLTRLVLRDGELIQEDLIAGVEQLQVVYGVDDNGVGTKTEKEDEDLSPNRYLDATAVEDEDLWDKVTDVRLSLVLRNTERDVAYTDTNTYRLYGGIAGAGIAYTVPVDAQNFRRKVFNTSVELRNLARSR
ncbi:MAG: PilW family protein [Gammaproteobacteria bacterium]